MKSVRKSCLATDKNDHKLFRTIICCNLSFTFKARDILYYVTSWGRRVAYFIPIAHNQRTSGPVWTCCAPRIREFMSYLYILTWLFGVVTRLNRVAVYLGNDHLTFREWLGGISFFLFPFAKFYGKNKMQWKRQTKNNIVLQLSSKNIGDIWKEKRLFM